MQGPIFKLPGNPRAARRARAVRDRSRVVNSMSARPIALIGVFALAVVVLPRWAAATSDSTFANPELRATTAPPWNPPAPIHSARPWETALRLPGRIVSLPLVALGAGTNRSLLYLEQTFALDRLLAASARMEKLGIVTKPASLGDHSGFGGAMQWAPPVLEGRLVLQSNATLRQYNRERVTFLEGPLGLVYNSEWRPREPYFGAGLGSPQSGESAYAERSQSARLMFAWGWQHHDSTRVKPTAPLIFRDGVRVRGPMHRTWMSAWAGPRVTSVTRGRDPSSPSFEIAHPLEAVGSIDRRAEYFAYGAGLSHDTRWGRPHWANGWRASVEAERYDKSIRALALNDAQSGARSFTRLIYRAETGASFGRDARTLRLALTAVDQRLDDAGGTFLIGDLRSLGGSAGLAGYESGRFRDLDLMLARLSYIVPLAKSLEFDLHTESGAVSPDLRRARVADFRNSYGAALRLRTEAVMLGAVGFDWSSEAGRLWFALGGVE